MKRYNLNNISYSAYVNVGGGVASVGRGYEQDNYLGYVGWYDVNLENWNNSLDLLENEGGWSFFPLSDIGIYYFDKGNYDKAIEYLEKSISIQRNLENKEIRIQTITYLALSYKKIGGKFDEIFLSRVLRVLYTLS